MIRTQTAPKKRSLNPVSRRSKLPAARFAVGVDIANRSFVATILTAGQWTATSSAFAQSDTGFKAFIQWLTVHGITRRSSIIGMETTGVYSQRLCLHLLKERFTVTVIDAASIARHRAPSQPKSDPADSRAIAEYLFRYPDKAHRWQPKAPELQQLATLLSLRELYVRNRTAAKNHRHAQTRAAAVVPAALQSVNSQIDALSQEIKHIEAEIKRVVKAHPELQRKVDLLCTMPGVQLLFAVNFLLAVESLGITLNPRTMANYLGTCPHEYSSGTSVKKRARSSRLGPPRLRKLLNLAARSCAVHNERFRQYYQRKLREGKAKMLILNNIANELVRIACALLRSNTVYLEQHLPVKPLGS